MSKVDMTSHVANESISSDIELQHAGHDSGMRMRKSNDRDAADLARTGKQPVLKRRFGWLGVVGFSTLILATWEGTILLFGVGFLNGGPSGLIYGFIVVWAGTLATFISLAELVSMAPSSGGQYHWVSILAPASCQKVLSYITGWLTVGGWQAAVASAMYIGSNLFQGLIALVKPDYVPQLWHGTLLLYACLAFCVFMNTVAGSKLNHTESVFFILYLVGYFAILIPLVYLAPHGSAKDVFNTFLNNGGWPSYGISFFVGLSGNAFVLIGADSVYHMSEEIHNATTTVPKAMITSIVINGVLGLCMYIAILFCIGDIDAVLDSPYGQPFIEIFVQGTNSIAGSAVMISIIIVVFLGGCIGYVAAASRQLWSFARDRGLPGWRQLSKVQPGSTIPTSAIATTSIFTILVGLISIGSPVAFNDVVSLSLAALYSSYLIASGLLLWRRCTGSIQDPSTVGEHTRVTNLPGNNGRLVWGPWRIKGVLGIANNAFAVAYMIVILIFTWWPTAIPVTAATMNYSCVVFGAVAALSAVYYVVWAHKTYTGPVVDVQLD